MNPTDGPPAKRSPILRFTLLVALVAGGLYVVYELGILDWLRDGSLQGRVIALRDHWWTPLAVLGFYVLCGCLPLPSSAIVLTVGAVYGPAQGWALNLVGATVGAAAGFGVARSLGHDFVVRILGPDRWEKLDGMMTEHAFWGMVRARWMLPLSVVSYGGGLAGMRTLPYLASSVLGFVAPIGLYTYVGHLLLTATGADATRALRNAVLILGGTLAVSLIPPALKLWQSRRSTP